MSTPQNLPVAIGYLRVSTEGQVHEGVSLDAQRAKIKSWCDLNGYTLASLHTDAGISGTGMAKRPGLQAALAACEKGNALVVYSLSRLARSTKDTLAISERLDQAGADLVSLSERIDTTTAAGKMVFRMLAVLNEFERDQVAERTRFALQHKKAQGQRVGAIPYGYALAGDGCTLIAQATEQTIMEEARALHAAGLSLRRIAAELTQRGHHSRKGVPFLAGQIQRLIA